MRGQDRALARRIPEHLRTMAPELTKQLERARRSLEKNKLRDAVEEYQAIFDESPSNQEAILALGDLYVRLNEPVRAAHYYGLQFDRLLDSSDTAKASAIYARFLRGVPQPAERLIRYAVQLQKQNRVAEAVEQYNAAAERYHEMNQEQEALGCYEKIAQLDSENPNRHLSVAELAEKLGQKEMASHSYLRAGQLCQSLGEIDLALEYFRHAHELAPNDRTIALFFAEAKLRHGDPAGAVELLDPFAAGETDTTFLALFGEGLLRTGQLDRARDAFVAFYRQKQEGFTKMFELAGAYIRTGQDEKGADVLMVTKEWMKSIRRENEFAAQVDRMTTVYPNSLDLARLVAALYEELNRETKYFDSLVHLFDLYFEAGNIKAACDVLDRLVDIDPYDYRNHQRIAKLQGKADAAFLKNILARAAKAASVITRPEGFNSGGTRGERPAPQQEEHKAQQALDDLIVQVEIFLQYSLHAKAVERLEKIAEIFPDEEEKNERLHDLFERANWWPKGKKKPTPKAAAPVAPGVPAASPAPPVAGILGFDVDTQRDLSQISEFTRLMYRQASPREVVTAAAQEIGKYLNVSRCIVEVLGGKDEEPLAAEFTGPGIVPAGSAQIASLVSMLATSAPDTLGGIELSGPGIPALRELKLETVLGVRLVDKETRAPSGAVLVGSERMRQWRPNDSFFLQAVGDQILISANHTRTQAVVRTMAFADEKTGLVSRGAYVACLLAESSRARAQNTPVSLVILHIHSGGELLRQHGDAAFEKYIEQLARSLRGAVRQTDLAVKYTAWSLAFILPDTNAGSAKLLAEKLRQTASAVPAPWNGGEGLSLSAVIAEAAYRPSDDNEDRVTEWINRAEAGLDEIRQKTDEKILVLASP